MFWMFICWLFWIWALPTVLGRIGIPPLHWSCRSSQFKLFLLQMSQRWVTLSQWILLGKKWRKILLFQWILLDKSEQKYFCPSEYFWRIHRSGKLSDQQFSFACFLATAARNQFVGGAGRCWNSPKVERTLHLRRNPNIKQWQTISLNSPKLELALDRKGNHNINIREIIWLGDYSWALQKKSRRLQSNVKSLYPEPGIDLFCRDWGSSS